VTVRPWGWRCQVGPGAVRAGLLLSAPAHQGGRRTHGALPSRAARDEGRSGCGA